MPSSHLILGHPLLLLPPISPSITVFSNESTLRMSCPKHWSFSFSIIPSKEIPGLISFRMVGVGGAFYLSVKLAAWGLEGHGSALNDFIKNSTSSILRSEKNALTTIYDHWNSEGNKECSGEALNWGLSGDSDIFTFI